MIPLYGFLQGDALGLLILVQETDSVREVAAVLQQAACVRVEPFEPVAVYRAGPDGERRLALDMTVAETGLAPLDRIDVRRGGLS